MRLTTYRVLDVRLLGAILSLVVVVPKLSNPETMRRIAPSRVAQGEPGAHIMSFALSPTGREMATINSEGRLKLRAFDSRDQIDRSLDFRGYAQAVAFSPDGGVLAAVGETPAISLWDLRSRMNPPATILSVPIRQAKRMTYSPDGRTLAIAETENGTVLFWDLLRQQTSNILHHTSPVVSLAFSPDGRWFATGGKDDGSFRLWDLRDGSWRTVQKDDAGHGPRLRPLRAIVAYSYGARMPDIRRPYASCVFHRFFPGRFASRKRWQRRNGPALDRGDGDAKKKPR
jgi:WD40 repeat protein